MKKNFLLVVTALGIGVLLWCVGVSKESRQALNWSQVKGKVLSSELTIKYAPESITSQGSAVRWYGVDVPYEYSVGNRTYVARRVSFADTFRSPKPALDIMNKYRKQREVVVYYDPKDPREAVLEPWRMKNIFLPLMLGGLLAVMGLSMCYDRSLEIKVRQINDRIAQGQVYEKEGKWDAALAEYNTFIEMKPYLAAGYVARAGLYIRKKDLRQVMDDLDKALSIDPHHAFAYLTRAKLYFGMAQYDKSWDDVHKAESLGLQMDAETLKHLRSASGRNT